MVKKNIVETMMEEKGAADAEEIAIDRAVSISRNINTRVDGKGRRAPDRSRAITISWLQGLSYSGESSLTVLPAIKHESICGRLVLSIWCCPDENGNLQV
jgi:hypothetical protein